MAKKYFLTIIVLLIQISTYSQTFTVKDKETGKNIADVMVFNSMISVTTDSLGNFNLTKELTALPPKFSHPAYVDTIVDLTKANDTIIYMRPRVLDLNEIIISANKRMQNKKEVPFKVISMGKEAINYADPQTAADLLGSTGQIFIQKSQLGGGSPMIRGFAANRILIVVDGVRMNNAIYRSGNLQNVISIDSYSLENTEVLFGPGSVIYGSDAIGGVLNFYTISPKFWGFEDRVKASVFSNFSGADGGKIIGYNMIFAKKRLSIATSITFSDFNDMRMGAKGHPEYRRYIYYDQVNGHDTLILNDNYLVQRFSGYNQINILQKFGFMINKSWKAEYSFIFSKTSDIPRYDRLIQTKNSLPKYAEWYYGPQKWFMHNIKIAYIGKTFLFDRINIIASNQIYEESRHDRKPFDDLRRDRYEHVDIYTLNVDFDKSFNSNNILYYGLEATNNLVLSRGELTNIINSDTQPYASRYPDGSIYDTKSAYLMYKYRIINKLSISAGIRYSSNTIYAEFDTTFYKFPFESINQQNSAFSGSTGVAWLPDKKTQINISFSTGFRAPNIDDIGKIFDSEPGNVIVPNPDLQPEYAYNSEFQIIRTTGKYSKVDIAFFYTYLDNAIVRRDFSFGGQDSIMYDGTMSKVEALVNADNAIIYGVQASAKIFFSPFVYFDTYINYTKGFDSEKMPVRHVAPMFGSVHFIANKGDFKIDLYTNFSAGFSYEELAPSERSKPHIYAKDNDGNPYSPAWYTFNIKTKYHLTNDFSLIAGIENIFDLAYRPYSSGICAPGRNFFISLRVDFLSDVKP